MKRAFSVSLVALLLIAQGTRTWAEDSVEERLKRLEQLVQAQQQQLGDRDAQISRLTTAQNVSSTIASMPMMADAPKADDPNAVSVKWSNGLKFQTKDKSTSLELGGRMQWQLGYVSEDSDTQSQLGISEPDYVTLRRARLDFGGTMYKHIIFKYQMDLAGNGDSDIREMYMGIKDIPYIGTWRIGKMNECWEWEDIESSKYIQFVERSFVSQAFAAEYNVGMDFHNSHFDDRFQWTMAVYREDWQDNGEVRSNNNYVGAGRISGLPYWADEGKRHVHLGVSGRMAETGGAYASHTPGTGLVSGTPTDTNLTTSDDVERARFRARPSIRSVNRFLDTGNLLDIDGDNRISGELGFNWNSFNFTAEYAAVFLAANERRTVTHYHDGSAVATADSSDGIFLQGFRVDASYLITGESRPYKKKDGLYDRIKPEHNFAMDGSGFGAVQLTARFHFLDFSDDNISDVPWVGDENTAGDFGNAAGATAGRGTMWGAVAGVNWYLNPNTRIMANYNFINVNREYFDTTAGDLRFKDRDYKSHAFTFMFQVDW